MFTNQTRPNQAAYRLLCLLVIAGLLLSACQPGVKTEAPVTPGPTNPGDTPRPSERPAEPSPTHPSENDDIGDAHPIVTFAASEWERSLYEPLIEQFNREHSEMTVQFAPLPEYTGEGDEETFLDYYRLQASAGDTTLLWGITSAPARYFRDMTSLLEADPTSDVDDFWPGVLEACQDLEGRQLGVPLSININGIFYNPEAFNAAGLPLPKPGWTWDNFQDAINTLAKTDDTQIRYGLAEQYTSVLNPLIEAAVEDGGGDVDATTIQPIVQWYLDLVKVKAISPPWYFDDNEDDWEKRWQAWNTMWQSENRPVMWPGSLAEYMPGVDYMWSESDPLAGLAIKTDSFAPYPVAADNPNDKTTPMWSQCAAISAGSKNPRAAWTWLNYLTRQRLTREGYGAWETLQLPSRISVAESVGYWKQLPAGIEESIRFIVAHGWYGSTYADIAYSVSSAVFKTAAGQVDLITALADAKAERDANAVNITPSPTPNTTPIVVATPQPTLSADTIVIEYFNQVWGVEREALKKLVNEYNKAHPETTIVMRNEFSPTGDEDYLVAIAKKFDCFTWYTGYPVGENRPDLLNLDAFLQGEGPEFIQDFDAGFLNSFRMDGSLYGLPLSSQPPIVAYNADLLAKRGIEPPQPGWTLNDFIEISRQVASNNESDPSYGFLYSDWESLLLDGYGAPWADLQRDPPIPMLDSPGFADTLAWLDDLNKAGIFLLQDDTNWEKTQTALQDGQIAFWMAQVGMPNGWYFDSTPPFQTGATTMPLIENPVSSYGYWASEQGHFISGQSKNPQICWNWVKYLSGQPAAFTGVPARKSVQNSPAWVNQVGEQYAETYRLALAQVQRPDPASQENYYSPIIWPLYTWRQEILTALFKGDDYKKIIPQAQQKAEDYLACMAVVDRQKLTDEQVQNEVNRCAKQADPNGAWEVRDGGGGGGGGDGG